jgi:hypothetical protein
MAEKKEKILVPPENYVAIIARKNPRSKLERLIEMFGPTVAAAIMIEFAGQALYFPRLSTLNREVTVLYVRQELKNLRKDRPEFRKRIRQLAHLFKMPEHRILKIYRNGKYVF